MKNVLGSPVDFCFALVLSGPSNRERVCDIKEGTCPPVANECVNGAQKNIFFLLWQCSFNTHYVTASFRHKRKGSSPSRF